MKNKTTVIHHSADFDGIFCREIARKFLPDAELIGWNFGDAPLAVPEGNIYVMDLPLDAPFGGKPGQFNMGIIMAVQEARLWWIDHHRTAIENHSPETPGYRIDGVAACRLAWQWFSNSFNNYGAKPNYGEKSFISGLTKEHFVKRMVNEPWAVRLVGENDIWDHRDTNAALFQHGLRSRDLTNDWGLLLSCDRKMSISEIEALMDVGHMKDLCSPDGTTPNPVVIGLLEAGKGIQYAKTHENESIIKHNGFTIQFEGLTFLACNAARYNSHLFTAGLTFGHDACLGFNFDGKQWKVSLYHAPGKEHHDLSVIAKKHGGGGHAGACGFVIVSLPFLNLP